MKKLFTLIGAFFITYASFAQVYSIEGTLGVCAGSSTGLFDSSTGGTWSSSNLAVGTISSAGTSCTVTGISAGTTTISYIVGSSYATAVFVVSPPPAAITGATSVCVGSTIALSDATVGGTWSSSYTGYATVVAGTGVVTGVASGTVDINYNMGPGCFVSKVVNVGTAGTVGAISGASTICAGSSSTFTDGTSGGVWTSSDVAVATVGASTGVVTGVSNGTADISYAVTGACGTAYAVRLVTIGSTTIAPTIYGVSTLCAGSTSTLYVDSTTGGYWTSSNPAVATVGSGSGTVTGVSGGTATISYTIAATCGGYVSSTRVVTISTTTSTGTISGSSSVPLSGTTTLSETVSGGSWSSSDPSIATVGASTGVVTGIAAGTATITYTVTGCGGSAYTTYVVTVSAINGISGYVTFAGGYSGNVKVWLITYNPSTYILAAMDSTTVTCSGDSVYYQFLGAPTDSFRIKAAIGDSVVSGTGFIPTYHTSYFYWHDATVLYHTSGTSDAYQDINMAVGTVTSGPGFIGGNVMTGANRGTSGTAPAVGLLMVAETSTGTVEQQTATDASGNYSFNSLPLGTYNVHPEAINYLSTDYTSVTLTAAAPHMTAANFIQHTISRTITPGTTGVVNVNPTASSIVAFPNPTNGNLNVQWMETANETGNVTISDITGREVYKTTINMTAGTGVNQLDLSALTNGLYIISVKSGDINYNNKIQVQH